MGDSLRPFVGRAAELGLLHRAADEAEAGAGSVWLVVGEAGIGKSRLTEELIRHVEGRGFLTAWGRAWESGGAPAFWPWAQALRAVLRRRGFDQLATARTSVLSQILPELAGDGQAGVPNLAPEQARFRLLDAAVGLLLDAAEGGPLCIVLEDLHAADPSSLLLLELLAPQVRTAPLLIVCTHREVSTTDPEITRHLLRVARDARQLPLRRLQRDDVETYLQAVLPEPARPASTDPIHAACEGNPLFMVEISRWISGRSGAPPPDGLVIPATLRAVIRDRLLDVPSETLTLLEAAAIIGREFSARVLAKSIQARTDEIEDRLAEAAARGVIEAAGRASHRFSHVLVREVLYADVPPDRRASLHLRCADAILACVSDSPLPWSEIAHHLLLAGETARDRAVEAAVCAGEAAQTQLAFDDAVQWFERALVHLDVSGGPIARRVELLLGLGRARVLSGDVEGGRALCMEAAVKAREMGEPRLLARAALEYGAVFIYARVSGSLVALLEESLSLLGEHETALRARVLARLAAALQPAPDPEGPIAMARQAIELARTVGDSAVLLDTLRSAGSAMADLALAEDRILLDREHVGIARDLGETDETLRGTLRVCFDALELGDTVEAEQAVLLAERCADELGVPHALWRAAAARALLSGFTGQLPEATESLDRADRLAEHARDPNARRSLELLRVLLLRLQGLEQEAMARMPSLRLVVGTEDLESGLADLLEATLLYRLGRHAEAGGRASTTVIEYTLSIGDQSLLSCAADVAIARGDRALAERILERTAARSHCFVNWGIIGLYVGPPVALMRARLASFLGHDALAEASFREAYTRAEAARAWPSVAWTAWEHARHLTRGEDRDPRRREELLRRGEDLARQCALPGLLARIESASAGAPATLVPPPEPTSSRAQEQKLSLRKVGDVWEVRGKGSVVHLRDTKGLRMLAQLVDSPGVAIHVLDLMSGGAGAAVDRGDAGELIDAQARSEYRTRIKALQEEVAEAEAWNDIARAESARHELEQIEAELARGLGLGGRPRRAGSAAERARVNVQRRLRDVVRRLAAEAPELARDLDRSLRTGTLCVYEP